MTTKWPAGRSKLCVIKSSHGTVSFCSPLSSAVSLIYLETVVLRNHFTDHLRERETSLNPCGVTLRVELKLVPCEKHRRSDSGMSNFSDPEPDITQVYLNLPLPLNLPLEMRISQIHGAEISQGRTSAFVLFPS